MSIEIANDDVTLASTTESQAELDHAVSPDWRKPFTPTEKPAGESGEPSTDATKSGAESDPAKAGAKPAAKVEDDDEPLPKGVQKRIDRLTARLNEAEAKLNTRPQPRSEPAKPAGDPEPDEKNFTGPTAWKDYNRAHTAWVVREENRRLAAENQQQTQQERTREVLETYSERVTEYRSEHPDFDQVTNVATPWSPNDAQDVQASIAFRLAIIEADNGPAILEHLSRNPEEFAKFGGLSPVQVGIRVGRISAALAPEESAKPAPKPAISRAPAPITPVKGSHTAPTSLADPNISTDDFIRRREEQVRKNRRR